MTDKELVERLLDFEKVTVGDARDAALRIEALTAKVKLMDDLDVINGEKIEALTAKNEMLGREVNIARYGQPNFAWSVHVQVMDDLNAKLAKAVEALHTISGHVVLNNENEEELSESALLARALLAEIEGEKE